MTRDGKRRSRAAMLRCKRSARREFKDAVWIATRWPKPIYANEGDVQITGFVWTHSDTPPANC